MPSRADLVPGLLSPRYQGVEDPVPRQSRLKYLIITSVFLFSIAIIIYCIVGLVYSSQPHFLPATLAVGTAASVLVIGFILLFLKCWGRIRSRLPAIIPGNSRHGFEIAPDEEGSASSSYGGFRGWMTMDMPTKIGVAGAEVSNFLNRTGAAIFGPPARRRGSEAACRSVEEICRDNRAYLTQDHPGIKDETFGKMSLEQKVRCSTPVFTNKGRVRQTSTDARGRQALVTAGNASTSRGTSRDIASHHQIRGQSASGTSESRKKVDHQPSRSISSSPSPVVRAETARAGQPSALIKTRSKSASQSKKQSSIDSNSSLKAVLEEARNGLASSPQHVPDLPSRHATTSYKLANMHHKDSDSGRSCLPSRSHAPLPAPTPAFKPVTPNPQILKTWDEYVELGSRPRVASAGDAARPVAP